jgi:ankyrin repeat protein
MRNTRKKFDVNFFYHQSLKPEFTDDYGLIPLHLAATWGHAEYASYLIAKGVPPGSLGPDPSYGVGLKPIYSKCKRDVRTVAGVGAIHLAACYGHCAVLEVLLNNGVDVNSRTCPLKLTPLHLAEWNGQSDAVQLLLDRGADYRVLSRDHSHFASPASSAPFRPQSVFGGIAAAPTPADELLRTWQWTYPHPSPNEERLESAKEQNLINTALVLFQATGDSATMGGVKAAFVREAIKSHNASMLASLLEAHCDDDILAAWAFIGSYHDTSAGSASVVALRDVIQKHISGKFALDIDGVQLTERALRYVSGLDQDTSHQAELDSLYKLRCKEYPGKHPGGYGRDSSAPRQRTEFPDRFRFADAWRHGSPSGSLAQQMTDCDISSAWERGLLGASGWFTTALFQDTKEVLDFYAAEAVARREEKARAEAEIEKIQLFYEEAEARKEEERRRREMG